LVVSLFKETNVFAFYSPVKPIFRLPFAAPRDRTGRETLYLAESPLPNAPNYTKCPEEGRLSEVGILIIDNDVVSQEALRHVLDAEGWQVRVLPSASDALPEIASGAWNLAIVNTALVDLAGGLFAILRDLAQADADEPAGPGETGLTRSASLFA
jgi:PleD family two-component response regulator